MKGGGQQAAPLHALTPSMSPRQLQARVSRESGFSLIELLVVILIVGVLAAIAIPMFLSQKGKAVNTGAKTLASTAQTIVEVYATDHDGSYEGVTAKELQKLEASINLTNKGEALLKKASGTKTTYEIVTEAPGGATFTIKRAVNGEIKRECNKKAEESHGGCIKGSWGS